jgi:hypothetical protein
VRTTVAEFEAASVALNVYEPVGMGAILYVQLKPPDAFVVPEHAVPPLQAIAIADCPAYPAALKPTAAPTAPDVTFSNSCACRTMTVNVAVAEFEAASAPVNLYAPTATDGRMNAHTKLPVAFVVPPQAVPPVHEIDAAELPAYPVPRKVINVPTGPEVGLTDSLGANVVTVNVAVASFEAASAALNWMVVAVVGGRENAQTKLPTVAVPVVQAVPPVQFTQAVELPANPVPVKVTSVPTSPDVGLRAKWGTTVNAADAEFDAESVPTNV